MVLSTQLVLRVCESSSWTWSWSAVWVPELWGHLPLRWACPEGACGRPTASRHTHMGMEMGDGEQQPSHVSGTMGRAAPSDVMCWG